LLRDDLVLVDRQARGVALAGRLALVERVGSVVKLLDATPSPHDHTVDAAACKDLSAETYYRSEKDFHVLLRSTRLTQFVVLDVELIMNGSSEQKKDGGNDTPLYQGPQSGVSKYALADVIVARMSDFGVNDTVIQTVTHLGHLLQAGDAVLGYDLETAVGGDWELEGRLPSSYDMPQVVLVKKIKNGVEDVTETSTAGAATADETNAGGKRISKKKLRKQRKEGKKMRQLEASAVRMGFFDDPEDVDTNNQEEAEASGFDEHLEHDPALADELQKLGEQFATLE
jgi:hypothetical protein